MKRLFVLALMFLFLCSGCYQKQSPKGAERMDAYTIVSANIPFADKTNPTQFDRVSLIETDRYGRNYYSYFTHSAMLRCNIEVHLISQKVENGIAHYIPDFCYMIRKEEEAPFTEEEIAALKEINCWDSEAANKQTLSVEIDGGHKQLIDDWSFEQELKHHLNLDKSYRVLNHGMEILAENKQLFFCFTFALNEDKTTYDEKYYLLVYQADASAPIIVCQEVSCDLNCQNIINTFRQTWENSTR